MVAMGIGAILSRILFPPDSIFRIHASILDTWSQSVKKGHHSINRNRQTFVVE